MLSELRLLRPEQQMDITNIIMTCSPPRVIVPSLEEIAPKEVVNKHEMIKHLFTALQRL